MGSWFGLTSEGTSSDVAIPTTPTPTNLVCTIESSPGRIEIKGDQRHLFNHVQLYVQFQLGPYKRIQAAECEGLWRTTSNGIRLQQQH